MHYVSSPVQQAQARAAVRRLEHGVLCIEQSRYSSPADCQQATTPSWHWLQATLCAVGGIAAIRIPNVAEER